MIEAHAFFGRDGKPETTANYRRWLFYTALRFPSSTCAPDLWALPRLKSFGHGSVRNVGNWRAMVHGCEFKGMAVTAVRCAGCGWGGW